MRPIRTVTLIALLAMTLAFAFDCATTPQPEVFSFVIISDVHIPHYGFSIGQPLDEESLMSMRNPKRLRQFVDECLSLKPRPDFVINCGDTGDVGWLTLLRLYRKIVQPLPDAGIPVYTVVGNHDLDYAGAGARDLAEIFDPLGPALIGKSGTRYSFDHKGCHFVFINNRPISGLIRLNPKELAWLRNDLSTVEKNTPVLLFLHANMRIDDTHRLVEILQRFDRAVIFQGHLHSAGTDTWGGLPVILTGSLYGGSPEAGSYRLVTVKPDGIAMRTRDFAKPAGTFEPEEFVPFPTARPEIDVTEPVDESVVGDTVAITVKTAPSTPGTVEYSIPGFCDWTPLTQADGRWEVKAAAPGSPGRYFLALRFTGADSTVVLSHRTVRVPGERVREVWSVNPGSAVMGGPVIVNDLAIVPTVEGGIFAFRLEDGSRVWHRTVDFGQILGRLAVHDGTVFFGAGRTVAACDAASGELKWRTELEGTIVAGITAAGNRLLVPSGEGGICCLDARSGEVLWSYSVRLPAIMEPETDGERVYFGAMDGRVRALDVTTGSELWSVQWSSPEDSYVTAPFWPPVVVGGSIVICKAPADSADRNLAAFSAKDGTILWSRRLAARRMRLALDPEGKHIFADYAGAGRRGIQCLSAADGSPVWSQTEGTGMNAAVVTPRSLIVRDEMNVSCLDPATGAVRWTYRTNTGPQGTLYGPGAMAAAGDGLAVIGTMDGKVITLGW